MEEPPPPPPSHSYTHTYTLASYIKIFYIWHTGRIPCGDHHTAGLSVVSGWLPRPSPRLGSASPSKSSRTLIDVGWRPPREQSKRALPRNWLQSIIDAVGLPHLADHIAPPSGVIENTAPEVTWGYLLVYGMNVPSNTTLKYPNLTMAGLCTFKTNLKSLGLMLMCFVDFSSQFNDLKSNL